MAPHLLRLTVQFWRLLTAIAAVSGVTIGLAFGQATEPRPKVGVLWFANASRAAPYLQPFKQGLRDLGWIDGRTVHIIERYDNGDSSHLPVLAAELVALGANVLFVYAGAVPAARQATDTIPIVCPDFYDPVAEGATNSMARPSGNVTGISFQSVDSAAKRLQFAQELMPGLRRVGHLFDPDDFGARIEARGLLAAAKVAGIDLTSVEVRAADQFAAAFAKFTRERRDVVIVTPSLATFNARDQLLALASAARVPVVSEMPEFAEAGAILTYGPDVSGAYRRGAYFVDKILKGAKPADLPIEQPTKFDLVVNMKAATALRLKVPESIVTNATRVIR